MKPLTSNWPSSYTFPERYDAIGVLDRIIEYCTKYNKSDISILDVGCSAGIAGNHVKTYLEQRGFKIKIIGIDVNPAIESAARFYLDEFYLTNFWKFKPVILYDLVICTRVLRNKSYDMLADAIDVMGELLKKDGALITDTSTAYIGNWMSKYKKKPVEKRKLGPFMVPTVKGIYNELYRRCDYLNKRYILLISERENVNLYASEVRYKWYKMNRIEKALVKFGLGLGFYLVKGIGNNRGKPDFKRRKINNPILQYLFGNK